MESEFSIPKEARERYLERRKADLDKLQIALKSQAFNEFKRIGHQLKGNAASFGYPELEKIALQMEAAAERGDIQDVERYLKLLHDWLKGELAHST